MTTLGGQGDGNSFMAVLVDPSGTRRELIRNYCADDVDITNITLTLDDTSVNSLPGTGSCTGVTTGTFHTKDATSGAGALGTYPVLGTLTAAQTATPKGTGTLSDFVGGNPNGNWSLYVISQDSTGASLGNAGSGAWSLTISLNAAATGTTTTIARTVGSSPQLVGANLTLQATIAPAVSGGTVAFKDNGNTIGTCSAQTITGGGTTSTCVNPSLAEGAHNLTAVYSGSGSFGGSTSATPVFQVLNNATTSSSVTANSGQFCNTGGLAQPGGSGVFTSFPASPYPSAIFVGTNGSPSLGGLIQNLTVTLNSLQSSSPQDIGLMLVGPNGNTLDFMSYVGGTSSTNVSFTVSDSGSDGLMGFSTALVNNHHYQPTSVTSGNPTTYCTQSQVSSNTCNGKLVSGAPPDSFVSATNKGTGTLLGQFGGASPNGTWQLFEVTRATGTTAPIGSWCLTFADSTGDATQTVVSSSQNPSFTTAPNNAVTFTATITDTSVGGTLINSGTVDFKDNGTTISGCGAVNVVSQVGGGGTAQCSPASLTEGAHTITALYSGTASFGTSNGSLTQRADSHTTSSVNGATYTYCNPGSIQIPAGGPANALRGIAQPWPSNIQVGNLPGTLNTATVSINNFMITRPDWLTSLLVGPAGNTAQSFDFLSQFSSASAIGNAAAHTGGINFIVADAGTTVSTAPTNGSTLKPYSGASPNSYTSAAIAQGSIGPPAGPYNYASVAGNRTFTSTNSMYGGGAGSTFDASGKWSLYVESLFNGGIGSLGDTSQVVNNAVPGWCLNLTQNLPDVALQSGSQMTDSGNFQQGGTGTYTITVHNNGPGPTGNNPPAVTPQVVVTLDANLSYGAGSGGTNWTCGAPAGQILTCTFGSTVASGANFDALTINVTIGQNAAANVSSSATYSGGGDGTPGNNTATKASTVVQLAHLSIVKTHNGTNFTQGQQGSYAIKVHNSNQGGATNAQVTVEDILPAGLSFVSATGTNWNCINTSGDVVCTTSTPISANSDSSTITLTVNVAANATSPIQNTATVSGGGGFIITPTSVDTVTVLRPANVTNVTSTAADGTYGTGASVPITITFNNPVTVTGSPQLALTSGGTATYSTGSGTATLTFAYTVAAGQNSADLDYTSTSALTLNGGTIKDPDLNAAILTLPAPAASGSLGFNKDIVIDTTAPTVQSFKVLFGIQNYELIGSPRNRLPWQITGIQVTFSKPITSANVNSLTGVSTTGFSGLGTNTLTWTISPLTLGSFATVLAGSGANKITDLAGNPLGGGSGSNQTVKVLYADFNDDGVVNSSDLVLVNNARSLPYNVFADLNGDGVVDTNDVQIVRTRIGTSLP